jgi:hypothetical protein
VSAPCIDAVLNAPTPAPKKSAGMLGVNGVGTLLRCRYVERLLGLRASTRDLRWPQTAIDRQLTEPVHPTAQLVDRPPAVPQRASCHGRVEHRATARPSIDEGDFISGLDDIVS